MPSAPAPLKFQVPVTVCLSDEERVSGVPKEENVATAIAAMHRDGLVVLENAVDVEHVDDLNTILSRDAEAMAKLPTTHFNDVRGSKSCLFVPSRLTT